MKKKALLFERLENNFLHCFLCAHQCKIAENNFGFCGVRQNIKGELFTFAYGELVAANIDPIEKKPLFHFLPGTNSFSIATKGCNFRCGFCQNWQISQQDFRKSNSEMNNPAEEITPENIVALASKNKCASISYTYTEPTIFFEYALETMKIAKTKGIRNVFVTNGYMSEECLSLAKPYLDAANVDLKFFREDAYKRVCAASLSPVLKSIKTMYELGVWVEITTLIIPEENDSKEELSDLAEFLSSLNPDIPWHISRFHPDYKFTDHKSTPIETLNMAEKIGKDAGLKFVYTGNVLGVGEDTVCPKCKKTILQRQGFNILANELNKGKCKFCSESIPGVFL